MRVRSTVWFFGLVWLLVVPACASDSDRVEATGTASSVPSNNSMSIPVTTESLLYGPCDERAECGVWVYETLELDQFSGVPGASLAEIEHFAANIGADVVALRRIDEICVPNPGDFGLTSQATSLAYYRADELVQRRRELSPPTTDGGVSSITQNNFVAAWLAAKEPDVRFTAFALFHGRPARVEPQLVQEVDWYYTDVMIDGERVSDSPEGEIYISGHSLDAFGLAEPADC